MSTLTRMHLSALDTWFFRESRPMESIGGSELASVFPPPPRTVLGALRSLIGDAMDVDWQEFAKDEKHPVRDHIGFAGNLGPLRLKGLWLNLGNTRLFPVPSLLLERHEGSDQQLHRLHIGAPVETHLGTVRLPEMPTNAVGSKPIENSWITADGLSSVLKGELPNADQIKTESALFESEARLGIARDNSRRTVVDGALYQTRHLRPDKNTRLEILLEHAANTKIPNRLARFGGEGRLTQVEVLKSVCADTSPTDTGLPTPPAPNDNTRGLILMLLTDACLRGENGPSWLPDAFHRSSDGSCWYGQINHIDLTLHAAVIGKAHREGGWNLAEYKPRDVQSLIPAGSCYYVELADSTQASLSTAIDALHCHQIGTDTELGRGLIACGLWQSNEYDI